MPFFKLAIICLFILLEANAYAQNVDSTTSIIDTSGVLHPKLGDRAKNNDTTIAAHSVSELNPGKKKNNRFVWDDRKFKADSTNNGEKINRHSPLYAALFSLAVPGLGQAYNKKYWKIPIVYAGFGGLGYAVYYTASNFTGYRNAYRLQVDEDPLTWGSYKGVSDEATLKSYRDYYKKNLDISAICTGVWLALVIIDATVDAHLFEWNMKDDIHLSWQPSLLSVSGNMGNTAGGVKINISF